MAEVASKSGTVKKEDTPSQQDDGFKIVGIAVDLTGKSISDEMFQLSAHTIKNDKPMSFTQYIMPHRDVNLAGQKTHGVRVFHSYGVYRMLCDTRTGRIVRTKSEYSVLNAFMKWLAGVKGSSKGVILVHHGNTVDNMMPFMLQALDRYKLTDAFYEIVHGCVNCKTIAADLPEMKDRALSFQSLARRVLQLTEDKMKPGILQSAKNRAPLTYQMAMKILNLSDSSDVSIGTLAACAGKEQEREILTAQRLKSDKVRSLRPIFVVKRTRGAGFKERNRAAVLRRYLIDLEVDYETLKNAYTNAAKDGVSKIFECVKNSDATPKKKQQDLDELIHLIVSHFEKPTPAQDINANIVERGQGDGGSAKREARASVNDEDDEDEDEFEEAQTQNEDK